MKNCSKKAGPLGIIMQEGKNRQFTTKSCCKFVKMNAEVALKVAAAK